jgi:excisionase family DNA binding protein
MSIAAFIPAAAPLERPHLLDVEHVAHRLSMGEEYVRQLLRNRRMVAVRVGRRWRVDPADLEAFIDAHRVTLSPSTDKFCCPNCGAWKSKAVDSRPDKEGLRYVRWRQCTRCGQLFETVEELTAERRRHLHMHRAAAAVFRPRLHIRCTKKFGGVAGTQGFFAAAFRNPNKDERFQHNSHDVSTLASSESFVGSRLFASAFGFCQCNDTRNVTRRQHLRSSSRRKLTRAIPLAPFR